MNEVRLGPKQIFLDALELDSPEARDRFLDEACGGHCDVRARVEALLSAQGSVGNFLGGPPSQVATTDQSSGQSLGTLVGPYKLLEQIGEGGMGLVYMAEQQQPVRRLVALKIIKPGMDSKQVIARFEAERQALAMMDHPNIAKVLDAGTIGDRDLGLGTRGSDSERDPSTPNPDPRIPSSGRPYFVMELVRGLPINEFCDQKRLSVRERLQLFIQVCQAVQHAHQKGIIHRDLKPTNVLVTMADTVAFPKLLDFGIAKALGQSLTDNTLHTGYSQLVGTPLYMSPEQAEMNLFGVDTRSDVYSLGVLLYELLTGTTPFDKEQLTKAGFDEMRRIIREEEPETVSARIAKTRRTGTRGSGLGTKGSDSEGRPSISNPVSRTPRLSELDWIVMKALEKDRSRRYESASALAADIQRYLSDEPVLACPPTATYRFQKFARKHKPALATAAAIAACLILGTSVSAWQAVRATTAEGQAKEAAAGELRQRQLAEANQQKANAERDEVKALNEKLAAKEQQLQRTLYAAHMNLAKNAWDASDLGRVNDLLDQHRPQPGKVDLRGFEWRYLYRLGHSEILTLKGHSGPVESVAYSPDGKRLASASYGDTVKVWDAQTGQELLSFKGYCWSGAFSPDGKHLAGADGKIVKVWDAHTGQELLSLPGQVHFVSSVVYSPDGKRLASGSAEWATPPKPGEVKVWNAKTGQELLSLKGHTGDVLNVAFSPNGKRLASGDRANAVKVWDAQTGQKLLSLDGHAVAFSPDNKRLASDQHVWDAQTGQKLLSLHGRSGQQVNSVAFSSDGKRLASAGGDRSVKVWDAQTGQDLFTFRGHTAQVWCAIFSPDGTRLASASLDRTIKIWDVTTNPEVHSFSRPTRSISSMAFSLDGKRLAAGDSARTVTVWDAKTRQELLSLKGHTDWINSVAFSPDGKRLASASADKEKTVKLWDAQTGQELFSLKGGGANLSFSPDGERLASGSGSPIGDMRPPITVQEVKVWDVQTGQELLSLKGEGGVAYSPDGKRLVSAGRQEVKVWDAQSGQELLTLKGGGGWPFPSVAYSPDGKRLASSSTLSHAGDPGLGEVKVWDAQTGEELFALKGHTGHINCVIFSPDGTRLVTTDWYNKTVKVWDALSGQELLALTLEHNVDNAAFSPDGNWLLVNEAGTVKIYDATPLPEKP